MLTMTSAKLQTPQIVTNASCVIIIAVDHSQLMLSHLNNMKHYITSLQSHVTDMVIFSTTAKLNINNLNEPWKVQ